MKNNVNLLNRSSATFLKKKFFAGIKVARLVPRAIRLAPSIYLAVESLGKEPEPIYNKPIFNPLLNRMTSKISP